MKPLSLLLVGLLLAVAFNFGLDVYQQVRFRALTPAVAQMSPFGPGARAFDERLAVLDDPAELRQAARQQQAKRQDTFRLLAAVLDNVNRTNGTATLRSGTLLVLALGTLGFALRAGPSTTGKPGGREPIPPFR